MLNLIKKRKHFSFVCVLLSLTLNSYAQSFHSIPSLESFSSSIRSIYVQDAKQVAFAGSDGLIGFTSNGGETWDTTRWFVTTPQDSIITPSFRACSITQDHIIAVAIASPGFIIRAPIKDIASSSVLYSNYDEGTFWDSMQFWDSNNGIMMGDPIGDCLSIYLTDNGGDDWNRVDCSILPPTIKGEAAFAASNGNISCRGSHAWIATGGGASRVFHTPDKGLTWEVNGTPLIQGGTMTGAFAIAFKNENEGIVIGGDWENQDLNFGNIAYTSDGGDNWILRSEGTGPGYRSCIIWRPNHDSECVAIGSKGIDKSLDNGLNWEHVSDDSYFTGRFSPDGNILWLAGHKKIGKTIWPIISESKSIERNEY
jgi:photosystem II stability/assembly factor-like uncharacterized protein